MFLQLSVLPFSSSRIPKDMHIFREPKVEKYRPELHKDLNRCENRISGSRTRTPDGLHRPVSGDSKVSERTENPGNPETRHSVQFNSHLFSSPIGARTLKMPVPYSPPNVGAYTRTSIFCSFFERVHARACACTYIIPASYYHCCIE